MLEENPGLQASDVMVEFDAEQGEYTVDVTEEGVQDYREQQAERAGEVLSGASGRLSDSATTVDETAEFEEDRAQLRESTAQTPVDETAEFEENVSQLRESTAETMESSADNVGAEQSSAQEIGGDATTYSDRELQVGEQTERVRSEDSAQPDAVQRLEGEVDRIVGLAEDQFEEVSAGDAEENTPGAAAITEYVDSAEVNEEVAREMTTGGLLAEEPGGDTGAIPSQIGPLNISEHLHEQGFRSASQDYTRELTKFIEEGSAETKDEGPIEDTVEGVALGLGQLGNVPGWIAGGETIVEAGEGFMQMMYEDYPTGTFDTSQEIAETGTAVAREAFEQSAESLRENPDQGYGALAGAFVGGLGAGRAVEKAGRAPAAFNIGRRADGSVDYSDITSARGARGEPPEFDTDRGAPTDEAVAEIRERARDNPEAVKEAVDNEEVLYRSESERLPEDVTAERGQYELPGLFASPDASPLRLSGTTGGYSLSSLRPRFPRPRRGTNQLSAFDSDDIPGYARRCGWEWTSPGPRDGRANARSEHRRCPVPRGRCRNGDGLRPPPRRPNHRTGGHLPARNVVPAHRNHERRL